MICANLRLFFGFTGLLRRELNSIDFSIGLQKDKNMHTICSYLVDIRNKKDENTKKPTSNQ